jgi:hypothetical protein
MSFGVMWMLLSSSCVTLTAGFGASAAWIVASGASTKVGKSPRKARRQGNDEFMVGKI